MIDLDDLLDEVIPAAPFLAIFTVYNTILLVFTATDHSFFFRHEIWFGLGFIVECFGAFVTIIILEKWYSRVIIACFPISLIAYPMIITQDYREQIQVQQRILTQKLSSLVMEVMPLEIKPAPTGILPKRPYVFMIAPPLDSMPNLLGLSVCAGDELSETVGGTPFGIRGIDGVVPFGELNVDITTHLLNHYPDFRADTKSIIIITQNWQESGRLVKLDVGEVPELLHHVTVFVVEYPTGYLLWKKLYIGGPASLSPRLPFFRSPTGGVSFVSYLKGSKVDLDLSDIPWDPATSGVVHE